jgi:hypothetical protein
MARVTDRTAWDVLSFLSLQTTSEDHAKWFRGGGGDDDDSKSMRTRLEQPQERYYSLWELADEDEKRIIVLHYAAFRRRAPFDYHKEPSFAADMKFLRNVCLMLNDFAKRTLLLERIATDPKSGKLDVALATHFENKFQGRAFHEDDRRHDMQDPILFIKSISEPYITRLCNIETEEFL